MKKLAFCVRILSLLGIAIATYITIAHAAGAAPACLAHSHGCETVAQSHWAALLGVRVSLIGVIGYVLLFVLTFPHSFWARALGFFGATFGLIFSAWLTYIEVAKIHAICQWCVASAIVMTILFITQSVWSIRSLDEADEI